MKPSAPTRILFIGNSFTNRNDLPGMLARLAAADKPPRVVQTDRVIANGMSLKAHWNNGAAREAICGSKWDYVILQEGSTSPLKNKQRMHESITLFDAVIREAGAKTVLYLTWARQPEWERQAELTEAYLNIGRQLDALIAPVGVAWQQALKAHPDLVLHDKDNSHPNLAGSYLAACVFFATLFRSSPVGIHTSDVDGSPLTQETANDLQATAWEVVKPAAREPA
jgi:hypothetical protein